MAQVSLPFAKILGKKCLLCNSHGGSHVAHGCQALASRANCSYRVQEDSRLRDKEVVIGSPPTGSWVGREADLQICVMMVSTE